MKQAAVSLTTFVDFVSKGGTPKLTVVRQWKNKEDYSPVGDFYKRFRETAQRMHEQGLPLSSMDGMLDGLRDTKKRSNYPEAVSGYKRWCKKKDLVWFQPPKALWRFQSLEVNINPELGLEIDGTPHLIKLYMKNSTLAANRVELIANLLAITLSRKAPKHCVMGVLDVRRSKLHTPTVPNPLLTTQLEGEAAYWCHVWDKI